MGPAIAMAAPYVLQGLSALGGVFGKKKKYMDNETLRALYGPQAIGKDTQEIANFILNSPYGQQLMAQAAEAGQGLQTEMASRAASAGLSPDTGGESGASTFATSAATQAQTGLERQTRAGIYQSAMPIAGDLVQGRMAAALNAQGEQNATPNFMQRLGAAAGQTAASLAAPSPAPVTAQPAAAASALAMPRLASNGGAPQLPYGMAPQPALVGGTRPAPDEFSSQPRMFSALSGRNSRSAGMRRSLSR